MRFDDFLFDRSPTARRISTHAISSCSPERFRSDNFASIKCPLNPAGRRVDVDAAGRGVLVIARPSSDTRIIEGGINDR